MISSECEPERTPGLASCTGGKGNKSVLFVIAEKPLGLERMRVGPVYSC